MEIASRDGERALARRFRMSAPQAQRRAWPAVTVAGVDAELLALCGATNPAGHQALPLGGYSPA